MEKEISLINNEHLVLRLDLTHPNIFQIMKIATIWIFQKSKITALNLHISYINSFRCIEYF